MRLLSRRVVLLVVQHPTVSSRPAKFGEQRKRVKACRLCSDHARRQPISPKCLRRALSAVATRGVPLLRYINPCAGTSCGQRIANLVEFDVFESAAVRLPGRTQRYIRTFVMSSSQLLTITESHGFRALLAAIAWIIAPIRSAWAWIAEPVVRQQCSSPEWMLAADCGLAS